MPEPPDRQTGNPRDHDPQRPLEPGDGQSSQTPAWPWLPFVWLAMVILLLFHYLDATERTARVEIGYSEFREAVSRGWVEDVILRGEEIEGRLTPRGREALEAPEPGRFRSIRPDLEDSRLLELLERHEVDVSARSAKPPWWHVMLVGALPWILILGLLLWFWNRMQSRMMAGGGPYSFGRSQARRFRRENVTVTLDDVAGVENAKREIVEVVEFLRDPGRFENLGAKIPRGILMMGPPGTGKTLMAKAIAGSAGVPFFSISGSEFIEMFVGVGASRVRDLFRQGKEAAPSVIFIDEIDSVGRTRGAGLGGGHDEREQTLNQILAEMDGFEGHEAVIVLAATNRPDVLDPALLRPGRFDRKVTLENPHREARRAILEVHTRKMPLTDDVDLDHLAQITIGFSGADLANLANEAALQAGRRNLDHIDWSCFVDARDRLLLGAVRESTLSERDRQMVAYHESGHAILAWLLPHADPLEKVTIVPRGQALGVTAQMPDEERHHYSEAYLRDRIAVMFGGRLAESIVFGEVSSGAEHDLRQATQLARRMVAHWGMSSRIGPASFPQAEEHVFLGREISQAREYSEATAAMIDDEVRKLLRELEAKTRELLESHRKALDALAAELLEKETLGRQELRAILEQSEAKAPGKLSIQ